MSVFGTKSNLFSLYKLILPEKKLLAKFSLSLIVSSGSALCFPLAMNDIYSLCKEKTEVWSIVKSVSKWTVVFTFGALATYTRRLSIDQLV